LLECYSNLIIGKSIAEVINKRMVEKPFERKSLNKAYTEMSDKSNSEMMEKENKDDDD